MPAFPGRRRCGKQQQEQTRSDRERRRATESARHGSRGIMGAARDRPPFHPDRGLFRLHFRKAGPPQEDTAPAFSRPQRIAGSVRRLRRFGRPGEFPPKPPSNNAAPAARPLLKSPNRRTGHPSCRWQPLQLAQLGRAGPAGHGWPRWTWPMPAGHGPAQLGMEQGPRSA